MKKRCTSNGKMSTSNRVKVLLKIKSNLQETNLSLHKKLKNIKMKTPFLFFPVIALLLIPNGCIEEGIRPAGETTIINYEFEGFTSVDVSDAFNIEIIEDMVDPHLSITIDDNLTPYLEVYVQNNRLFIGLEDHITARGQAIQMGTIYVSSALSGIKASGASQIILKDSVVTGNFNIDLSGASQLTGFVNVSLLDAEISGASTMTLEGKAQYYQLEISGASSARGYDLIVQHAYLEFSGASACMIQVEDILSVEASGASTIRYMGSPTILRSELSGSSNLIHIQ